MLRPGGLRCFATPIAGGNSPEQRCDLVVGHLAEVGSIEALPGD
jgi:hypothetical protein